MENAIRKAEPRSVALAALYICESLLLELEESGRISHSQLQNLLKDAVESLRENTTLGDGNEWIVASEIVETIRVNHERVSS